jgi:MGT family glycosyltransferase
MSKVIFLIFPTHGCINPLLATVSELVQRGEKSICYCAEEFRNKIEKTGAEFRSYSGLINKFQYPENDDLLEALKILLEMTIDKLDYNLDEIRKENPDYIIHDSVCTWGKYMASILNLPAINLMHSYPITKSSIPFTADTAQLFLKVGYHVIINKFKQNSPIKILKRKYGISLSLGDILINKENLNIIYNSKYMAPEIFQSEKTYRFVGPSLFFKNEPNVFSFDKLNNRKVIYISLGTLHNKNSDFYKTCLEAFSHTEYYVIISVGFNTDLNEFKNIPNNFLIRQSVPQQKLLDYVDLFITHAGMNSVNEAICSGVTMLLLPHQFEQKMIADRVQNMGIGIVMNIKKITPEKLYKKANRLISDSNYKKQALTFKSIFNEEEKTSHIKAADEILHYIRNEINSNRFKVEP